MRRHALLLLACPRSGATALAGALVRAGAVAGGEFVASPPGEPKDNWQCAPLVALNERLLALLGLRWDSLVSPPDRWLERPAVRALTADADALIATQFGTRRTSCCTMYGSRSRRRSGASGSLPPTST